MALASQPISYGSYEATLGSIAAIGEPATGQSPVAMVFTSTYLFDDPSDVGPDGPLVPGYTGFPSPSFTEWPRSAVTSASLTFEMNVATINDCATAVGDWTRNPAANEWVHGGIHAWSDDPYGSCVVDSVGAPTDTPASYDRLLAVVRIWAAKRGGPSGDFAYLVANPGWTAGTWWKNGRSYDASYLEAWEVGLSLLTKAVPADTAPPAVDDDITITWGAGSTGQVMAQQWVFLKEVITLPPGLPSPDLSGAMDRADQKFAGGRKG